MMGGPISSDRIDPKQLDTNESTARNCTTIQKELQHIEPKRKGRAHAGESVEEKLYNTTKRQHHQLDWLWRFFLEHLRRGLGYSCIKF
jgi:hypothetical protein